MAETVALLVVKVGNTTVGAAVMVAMECMAMVVLVRMLLLALEVQAFMVVAVGMAVMA
jgi:hypothetical protein